MASTDVAMETTDSMNEAENHQDTSDHPHPNMHHKHKHKEFYGLCFILLNTLCGLLFLLEYCEKPIISFVSAPIQCDDVCVHFLPLNCLTDLHSKSKFQKLFNIVFMSTR